MTNSDGAMCHTSAERPWPWPPRGHRCNVTNYIHADASWPVLPSPDERETVCTVRPLRLVPIKGNYRRGEPARVEIEKQRVLIESQTGLTSQESERSLFHLPIRARFFIKGSEWSVTVNPWISLEGFIYLFITFLLLLLAHPILPVVSFPKWISGSQRREL